MPTGVVKGLKIDRGFGFIAPDGGGSDIFFHARQLDDSLPFDEQLQERHVQYETEMDSRSGRLRAKYVRPAR